MPDKTRHEFIGVTDEDGKIVYGSMLTSKFKWCWQKAIGVSSLFGYCKNLNNQEYEQYISPHMRIDNESMASVSYEEVDLKGSLSWQGSEFEEFPIHEKANYLLTHKNTITYDKGKSYVKIFNTGKKYHDILNLDKLPTATKDAVVVKFKLAEELQKEMRASGDLDKFKDKIKDGVANWVVAEIRFDHKDECVIVAYVRSDSVMPYDKNEVLDSFDLGELKTGLINF